MISGFLLQSKDEGLVFAFGSEEWVEPVIELFPERRLTQPFVAEFLRHAPTAIAMFDNELRYLMVTDKWLEDYGLEGQDILGKSHYEIFPEIPNDWKDLHQQTLKGETLHSNADPFLREDGKLDWVKWKNVPWYRADGLIGGMIMFTEVISDQILMAKAMENAVGGMAHIDIHGRYVFANSNHLDMFEFNKEDLIGSNFLDGLVQEDRHKVEQILSSKNKKSAETIETFAKKSNGGLFQLKLTLTPDFTRSGERAGHYLFTEDITAEKTQAEKDYRQTEWLKMTQKMAQMGHWFVDLKNDKIFWSEEVYRIHGLDPKTTEPPSMEEAVSFYHPDDKGIVEEALEKAMSKKEPFTFELRLIRRNGEVRWVSSVGECRLDKSGNVDSLFGVFQDITLRRKKNEEIITIKERSETAMHSASVGIWELNPETDDAHWSSLIDEILGIEPNTQLSRKDIFARVHDEDKALVKSYPELLLEPGSEGEITIRMHHSSGGLVYVHLRGDVVRDSNGHVKSLAGSFTDVTKEKKAEELREELWNILSLQEIDQSEKIERFLTHAMAYFDLQTGVISKITETEFNTEYVVSLENGLESGACFGLEDTYWSNVMKSNRVHAVHSISPNSKDAKAFYNKLKIQSYIGAPILVAGRRYGIISFFSAKARKQKFSSTELQVIEQLAQWIGYEIERQINTKYLKESKERFATAVQGLSVGIWDWKDINQGNSFWSDHLYKLLGFYPGEIPATMGSFREAVHPLDKDEFNDALQKHLKQQHPFNLELRLKCKPGTYRWFLATGQAIWNSQGEAQRMIGSIKDVHDRKIAETMKSEFVSNVSHELRTPMTSIMGSIGLIRSGNFGELDPRAQSLLDIALKNGDRLVRLINDILDIEKIAAGKMEFHFSEEPITDLLEETISQSQAFADKHNAVITFTNEASDVSVKADKDRLIQVFTNLISNAAKFSGENGYITVHAFKKGKNVHISVKDNGLGIPKDRQAGIFEKFIQIDTGDKRASDGTGLGLSISKAIVDEHQGRIEVESDLGEGATFTVSLEISNSQLESHKLTADESFSENKDTILHVEDDPDVSAVVEHLIGNRANFRSSATIHDAWETLNKHKVDLILLDMQLPKARGDQLIKMIDQELNYKPSVMIYSVEEDFPDKFPDFVVRRFVKSKVSNDQLLNCIMGLLPSNSASEV